MKDKLTQYASYFSSKNVCELPSTGLRINSWKYFKMKEGEWEWILF
jgi:hypothetical protein